MKFSSRQLSEDKWGIYSGPTLLATVSCKEICRTVLANLASGRSDLPKVDSNALYQTHQAQPHQAQTVSQTVAPKNNKPGISAGRQELIQRSRKPAVSNTIKAKIKTQKVNSKVTAHTHLAEGA